jgi:hypothetical protein
MTENQSNQLVKNPNTKKAIAVLTKFAKLEAEYKTLEKESKKAAELIKEAMIDKGIDKIEFDPATGLTGFITLAERVNYKAEDPELVDDEFKKLVIDTDKVKAQATLTGELPAGIETSTTRYIIKKFKVTE